MKRIKEFDEALEIDESLNFKKKEKADVLIKILIWAIVIFMIFNLIFVFTL